MQNQKFLRRLPETFPQVINQVRPNTQKEWSRDLLTWNFAVNYTQANIAAADGDSSDSDSDSDNDENQRVNYEEAYDGMLMFVHLQLFYRCWL